MSRGNEKRRIYVTESDYKIFLELLGEAVDVFRWQLHSYSTMPNHYHLVLETSEGNLSRGIHQLNGEYAQKFNRRHGRVGHLFQGRFKGVLVEKETHFLELVRYVVLNPVRAGIVQSPEQWPWSNYRATSGLAPAPSWLEIDWTLSRFDRLDRDFARSAYRQFVAEGVKDPWEPPARTIFLGNEDFRRRLLSVLEGNCSTQEFAKDCRLPIRPSFDAILGAVADVYNRTAQELRSVHQREPRRVLAYVGRTEGAIPLAILAEFFGVTVARVSQMIRCVRLDSSSEGMRTRLNEVISRARTSNKKLKI